MMLLLIFLASSNPHRPAPPIKKRAAMARLNDDDDLLAICPVCGQQYGAPLAEPPAACKICEDDRQWTPGTGQSWTSLGEMKRTCVACGGGGRGAPSCWAGDTHVYLFTHTCMYTGTETR